MTVYDSLHSLLVHGRLLFHRDKSRTKNSCTHIELPYELIYDFLNSWMNSLLQFREGRIAATTSNS
jgi:hypothetical protein